MKLFKLSVENFRNLENQILDFSPGINCILGENGNGKTNLLEAIYFLGKKKSFRKNTSFPQILSVDSEKTEIIFSSLFQSKLDGNLQYSGKVTNEKKKDWYLNGVPDKTKFNLPMVFINPFDAQFFHFDPSFKRNWFDTYLSEINETYKLTFKKFQKCLKQRNFLLSNKPSSYLPQIKALNETYALMALEIKGLREQFLMELAPKISEIFKKIFNEVHEFEIKLESSINANTKQDFLSKLEDSLELDLITGHTKKGPHRDNYELIFDGFNSLDYCSLGQQKMSYLSLLFAYIDLFRYKFMSYPMVLIDDVSGELDRVRWVNLVEYLKHQEFQVFITTANDEFKKELEKIDVAKKIYVNQGYFSTIQ